jgi:hypothetical protein
MKERPTRSKGHGSEFDLVPDRRYAPCLQGLDGSRLLADHGGDLLDRESREDPQQQHVPLIGGEAVEDGPDAIFRKARNASVSASACGPISARTSTGSGSVRRRTSFRWSSTIRFLASVNSHARNPRSSPPNEPSPRTAWRNVSPTTSSGSGARLARAYRRRSGAVSAYRARQAHSAPTRAASNTPANDSPTAICLSRVSAPRVHEVESSARVPHRAPILDIERPGPRWDTDLDCEARREAQEALPSINTLRWPVAPASGVAAQILPTSSRGPQSSLRSVLLARLTLLSGSVYYRLPGDALDSQTHTGRRRGAVHGHGCARRMHT